MAINKLPRIIVILAKHDSGEFGNANCPHCDAKGRYTYFFLCENGERRGAMAGCLKLFPRSPLAKDTEALFERVARYKKENWNLPTWDQAMLTALEDFQAEKISLIDLENVIREQTSKRSAYHAKKFGKRGYGRR